MKPLILFFGHKNDSQGRLSTIALQRCDAVADLWRRNPDAQILVTAGFARHANGTAQPHWHYLAAHLAELGVPRANILSPFGAATTIDEVLRARMVLLHGDYGPVFGVTSDFHAERVQFLLGRVLRDVAIEVIAVPSQPARQDLAEEALSFAYLQQTWVQPPLYRGEAEFPRDAYEMAQRDRERHEAAGLRLPMLVIAYTLLVGALYHLAGSLAGKLVALVLGVTGQLLYRLAIRQADSLARSLRMYLRAIEVGFNQPGYLSGMDVSDLHMEMPPTPGTMRVAAMGASIVIGVLAADFVVQLLH